MNDNRSNGHQAISWPTPIQQGVALWPPGYTTVCTTKLADEIAEDIRKGATPHIAAAAHGVLPAKFREWLRIGRLAADYADEQSTCGYLYQQVMVAAATARARAEHAAYADNPQAWLAYTLGRDAINRGVQPEEQIREQDPRIAERDTEITRSGRLAEVLKIAQELGQSREGGS